MTLAPPSRSLATTAAAIERGGGSRDQGDVVDEFPVRLLEGEAGDPFEEGLRLALGARRVPGGELGEVLPAPGESRIGEVRGREFP